MPRSVFNGAAVNENGDLVPGASVYVTTPAGLPIAVYDQREGGSSLGNPFTTVDGKIKFYADPQRVDVVVSFGGDQIGMYENHLLVGEYSAQDLSNRKVTDYATLRANLAGGLYDVGDTITVTGANIGGEFTVVARTTQVDNAATVGTIITDGGAYYAKRIFRGARLKPWVYPLPTSTYNFFEIYNEIDDEVVFRFADGTASGDAHVGYLPLETRRNSHGFIVTAGSAGGEHDIDFRTYNYSDYFYFQGTTTFQSESMRFLVDINKSRSDGTKKDGTGGGGLSPAEDVYSFDAAMIIPSNILGNSLQEVLYPALGVRFHQHLALEKRSGATRSFKVTPNAGDLQISEETSGNTVLLADHEKVIVGGQELISEDKTGTLCESTGNFKICRNISDIGASTDLPLVVSGLKGCGEVFISLTASGGAHASYRRVIEFDGTTITDIASAYDTTAPQITISIAYDAGVLELNMAYSGGLGGACRAAIKAELIITAA